MSKLLAIVTASMFAFATTGVMAQGTGTAPKASELKVDCKDPKNKDHATCKAAEKSPSKSEMKSDKKDDMKKQNSN
jgi:hypothetical protein